MNKLLSYRESQPGVEATSARRRVCLIWLRVTLNKVVFVMTGRVFQPFVLVRSRDLRRHLGWRQFHSITTTQIHHASNVCWGWMFKPKNTRQSIRLFPDTLSHQASRN